MIILLCIYGSSRIFFDNKQIKEDGQYQVKVTKVYVKDDYNNIIGFIKGNKVSIYTEKEEDVLIGSTYNITGKLDEPIDNTIPNTFSYKNYLYSKNIKYTMYADKIEFVHKGLSIYMIGDVVNAYIERYLPLSKPYIKTFLLADKSDIDQDAINNINFIGISHMFAVSGYHIGLLVLGITVGLKKLKIGSTKIEIVNSVILLIYMIITLFSASVVRASLLYIFIVINKHYKLNLSILDLLSIIYMGLLIIRPYYFYNIGFVLSFLVTFVLILSANILQKKSKFSVLVWVSFIAFLASFPIILNTNYQINLLTLIFNVIIIYIMSVILLPATYITFIISIFDSILYYLYLLFESIIAVFSNIDLFVIKGYIQYKWEYMIIYILIYFIFAYIEHNKPIYKLVGFVLIFLFFITHFNWIDPRTSISFLDVDGDSTFIQDQFNRCNILIDTGEADQYDTVIHFIQANNIRRIDYLIVSHYHTDHYGEVNDILEKFDVNHVISKKNVVQFENSQITCGTIKFFIYPLPYDSENENNNSIIMSLFVEDKHFLFVGDTEEEREMLFTSLYDIDVDYLKVGHHGSSTSSSEQFLKAIKPEEAFIIVNRNNRNHHPSKSVIERFNDDNIKVHRTDVDGTIQLTYVFGKESKKYYRP